MSRAYRIRQSISVSDSLNRDVTVGDEICTELELLEILPPERMTKLLKQALRDRQFEEENGKMVRREGGITITIDPDTAEVVIRTEESRNLEAEGTRVGSVDQSSSDRERARVQEQLREALREELGRQINEKERNAQQRVSVELEAKLGDLSSELERVVHQVTAEALKEKARSLGEIKELTEDPESGSLTIKVEV
jgi:hypothetical protein